MCHPLESLIYASLRYFAFRTVFSWITGFILPVWSWNSRKCSISLVHKLLLSFWFCLVGLFGGYFIFEASQYIYFPSYICFLYKIVMTCNLCFRPHTYIVYIPDIITVFNEAKSNCFLFIYQNCVLVILLLQIIGHSR